MKPEHERALQGLRAELVARREAAWPDSSEPEATEHDLGTREAARIDGQIRALDAALAEIEQVKRDAVALLEGQSSREIADRVRGYARERAGREPGR